MPSCRRERTIVIDMVSATQFFKDPEFKKLSDGVKEAF